MKKKVIKLTEEELHNIIRDCLNEIGGKTLATIDNSAINSMNNIQNGVDRTFFGTNKGLKMVDHNANIIRADNLKKEGEKSFLTPYLNKPFLFWAYRRGGNPIHLVFKVENIKKSIDSEAILGGEVVFGAEQLPGDIVINFKLGKDMEYSNIVSYKYKGNSYKYFLEPNIKTKPLWDELVNGLKNELLNRIERGLTNFK